MGNAQGPDHCSHLSKTIPHRFRAQHVARLVAEQPPGPFQLVDGVAVEPEIGLLWQAEGPEPVLVGHVVQKGAEPIGRFSRRQVRVDAAKRIGAEERPGGADAVRRVVPKTFRRGVYDVRNFGPVEVEAAAVGAAFGAGLVEGEHLVDGAVVRV